MMVIRINTGNQQMKHISNKNNFDSSRRRFVQGLTTGGMLASLGDAEMRIGSGLSDASVGLRLRHEFTREFAPYIGVEWNKKFGNTADFAEADGADVSDTKFVAGIRAWF